MCIYVYIVTIYVYMYNRLRSENRFHGIVSFRTTPAAYLQTSRLRIALAVTGYRKREGGRVALFAMSVHKVKLFGGSCAHDWSGSLV